ncbi:MAG: hypothetical protein JO234_01970 [Hyphomicrobiales bacterium]|nr:hypothetical protein [Hyphomicrobiales bacterium]
MMTRYADPRHLAHEEIIANAMVDVATELRLADLSELVALIRSEQAANIADLVNSSSELFFRCGTLRYALSAAFDFQWESAPTVRLDMEFRNGSVCAFFGLVIGRKRAAVQVAEILFDDEPLDDAEKTRRLLSAIAEARLQPLGRSRGDAFDRIERLAGHTWRKPGASPAA